MFQNPVSRGVVGNNFFEKFEKSPRKTSIMLKKHFVKKRFNKKCFFTTFLEKFRIPNLLKTCEQHLPLLKTFTEAIINPTTVPNQGSAKNGFNDFKIDFPVQESDCTQKELPKRFSTQKQPLELFSNILEKYSS